MIHQLKQLYPNSLLNPDSEKIKDMTAYYLVENGNHQLYISLEDLNKREKELLDLLIDKKELNKAAKSPWENLLYNHVAEESLSSDLIRIVYLHNNYFEANNTQIWKETLIDSNLGVLDVIFVEKDLILIILDAQQVEEAELALFMETIQSLDQDFDLLTQGMIGQLMNVNRTAGNIYQYEKNMFQEFLIRNKIDGIVKISDLLIDLIAQDFKKMNPRLPKLTSYLEEKADNQLLIQQLFENQGNLSQTAEALYIHRNTLTYRINQFQEKTGFDLTYYPDLFVCYLLNVK